MTTTTILKKARVLIVRGWTQGSFARNARGRPVLANSKRAVRWCAWGALDGAYWLGDSKALRLLKLSIPGRVKSLSDWNDNPKRKKAEVLALFDSAIALSKKVDKLA
jgi:hypothetical protein